MTVGKIRDLSFASEATADFTATLLGSLDGIGTAIDSHYPMEEVSGTRFDATGNQENLEDINTVGQAAGQIGNAADIVRANSETLRGTITTHSPGNADITFAGWFRVDTVAVTGALVSKTSEDVGAGEYQLQFVPGANRIRWIVFNPTPSSTIVVANSFGNIPRDVFLFVVCWHDATANTINIQINNGTVDSAAFSASGMNQGNARFRVGAHGDFEPNDTTFIDGRVDELVVLNRVLTAGERSAMYAGGAGVDLQDFHVKEFVF